MPVTYTPEGHIANINFTTPAEAKIILKEIKLKKKEYGASKKEISADIAQERANLRSRNIGSTPAIRPKGTIGKFVGDMGKIARASDKGATDRRIVQLEELKRALDERILRIDNAVIQIEKWLLAHPS